MKQSGIYKLKLKDNPTVYIGSSIDIGARIKEHNRDLLNGKHHNYRLQNDFNIYIFSTGIIPTIEHEVLLTCSPDDLDWYELLFMHLYDSVSCGYNITYDTQRTHNYRSVSRRY